MRRLLSIANLTLPLIPSGLSGTDPAARSPVRTGNRGSGGRLRFAQLQLVRPWPGHGRVGGGPLGLDEPAPEGLRGLMEHRVAVCSEY